MTADISANINTLEVEEKPNGTSKRLRRNIEAEEEVK
jgi:hypothetical protein